MLKPKNNINMRIKKQLLPEIDSDINRFKKLHYSEISSKDNALKINNSYLSNDENNEYNENKKYISGFNDLEKLSNSTNNNTKKSPLVEIKQPNNSPLIIYEKIKLYIEKFMSDYINEKESIYFILKEILNAIIIIIKDFVDNNNTSSLENNNPNVFVTGDDQNNNENNNLNLEVDINSKIVFLLKIQKLNNTIKKLKEEMAFFKSIIDIPNKKFGNNFINLFKKKYDEQKAKCKKEELNYLLCIGEQDKKIISLEKEINKKEKENLPNDIIKSIRCFPNFHQYDFKEDINPKSIPLFQQFQKEKKIDKYLQKDIFKSPKNLSSDKNKRNIINKNMNNKRAQLLLTNPDFKRNKNLSNINSFSTKKSQINLHKINTYNIGFTNDNNDNNINKEKDVKNYHKIYNKMVILNTESNIINDKEYKNQKKIHDYFKDYYPKTILDNKKEFFIAHPTLSIAGIVKNNELKYIGLPKKLIRLKFHKNLEKNMMITFPSSLNETLVNLEKLRKCKNVNNKNN